MVRHTIVDLDSLQLHTVFDRYGIGNELPTFSFDKDVDTGLESAGGADGIESTN